MSRLREKMCMSIAWMLPKEIVKWCFYRMCAHATQGKYGEDTPCGMTWETIAKRWEDEK